jgi:hypothetical protein
VPRRARAAASSLLAALALLLASGPLAPLPARAGAPVVDGAPADVGPGTVTIVQVTREKPAREKHPTLRFLKANRDFIRARFDRLRTEKREAHVGAGELDPRFLAYRSLLAEIALAKDSVRVSAEERERHALFERVGDLGKLEAELDQMERLLAAQQVRLRALQADFAGRQRTELNVMVTGGVLAGVVDSVVVQLEDGTRIVAGLDDTQRQALVRGGAFEVFRGLVEPREQVVEIRLEGEGWSQAGAGYVTLEPVRDRLTFLRLDLSQAHPARGLASVVAGVWRHEEQAGAPLPAAPAAAEHPSETGPDRERP